MKVQMGGLWPKAEKTASNAIGPFISQGITNVPIIHEDASSLVGTYADLDVDWSLDSSD